jgi:ATP-dependent DNA ligase
LNAAITAELKGQSAVLGGEIVCLDDDGRTQFRELLFHRGEPRFIAFDLLWCEGEDLRYLPLCDSGASRKLAESSQPALFAVDRTGRTI